jgi:hypothetical protein
VFLRTPRDGVLGLKCLRWQNLGFNKESRSRCRRASAYDAKGGSAQFRAILQVLPQIYSSFLRPYGTVDGLTAIVVAIEGYADAYLFGSLRDSKVTAHFRVMSDPSGDQLRRDVHRRDRGFDGGNCNIYVARSRRRTSISLLLGA